MTASSRSTSRRRSTRECSSFLPAQGRRTYSSPPGGGSYAPSYDDATLSFVSELVAAPAAEVSTSLGADPKLRELKRVAIVPALNEEHTIGRVIDELRAFDPGLDIVVVDDGSVDGTSRVAGGKGARVLRLPFNLGIGGAGRTGVPFALEN